MAAIYTANHLQKNYGGHVALRDVSFSIAVSYTHLTLPTTSRV